MGNTSTLFNETPYTWYYRTGLRGDDVRTLHGNSSGEYVFPWSADEMVFLRYGNHTGWDLRCPGCGYLFTLKESANRQHFELINNSSGIVVDRCPNFAPPPTSGNCGDTSPKQWRLSWYPRPVASAVTSPLNSGIWKCLC